jgi:hypothetical protein
MFGYSSLFCSILMKINASLAAAASAVLIDRPSARTLPLSHLTST